MIFLHLCFYCQIGKNLPTYGIFCKMTIKIWSCQKWMFNANILRKYMWKWARYSNQIHNAEYDRVLYLLPKAILTSQHYIVVDAGHPNYRMITKADGNSNVTPLSILAGTTLCINSSPCTTLSISSSPCTNLYLIIRVVQLYLWQFTTNKCS